MEFIFSLVNRLRYFYSPLDLVGRLTAYAVWIGVLFLLILALYGWRQYNRPFDRRHLLLAALLTLAVPLTSLFVGIKIPTPGALPPTQLWDAPPEALMMVFAALPWMLAGGLSGPLLAAILGALSGFMIGWWGTHSFFLPLELGFLAALFAVSVNQRYRGVIYRIVRQPFFAAILLSLLYPFFYFFGTTLGSMGELAARLDYTIARLWPDTIAVAGELLLGGLFAQVISAALTERWGSRVALQPSPLQRSLRTRLFYFTSIMAVILMLTLIIADWVVAGNAARQILRNRMSEAAETASVSVPYFIEVGQNHILEIASDERLYTLPASQIESVLEEQIRRAAFFSQLFVLDMNSDFNMVASYPPAQFNSASESVQERLAVNYAQRGVPPVQVYAVPAAPGGDTAQVSYIASIKDARGTVRGVLIGRTDLATNMFTRPLVTALRAMTDNDGMGILIDAEGNILYHPDSNLVMTPYFGQTPDEPAFYDEAAADGTRKLVFYQPVQGRAWAVVISVPAQRIQEIALSIAYPLMMMIVVILVISLIMLNLGLNAVVGSLQELAHQAGVIASGDLEHSLNIQGEDEVGQLSKAFERMRVRLKGRLSELSRLLNVTQGVASSLEMHESVDPVLAAALANGAASARVVLAPSSVPDLEHGTVDPVVFARGPMGESYAYLDEQILMQTRQGEKLVLSNLSRGQVLRLRSGGPRPGSILAASIRHEQQYFGVLWAAYETPREFTQEEVDFFETLAGQAGLAAANSQLFLKAEIGRQRLAAILASTPDPVLVTDQKNRLLLANPAAWRVLGLGVEWEEGRPIDKVISHPELLEILNADVGEKRSVEITLNDEQIYFATASTVLAEGQRVGRVCVLRDITNFKELDALKSEFVATVSHDLRSPLTLMRGYATMLEMVGELNEQQQNYVRKIVNGVESMSRLVNNLLDLGRIEAGVGLQLDMVPVYDIIERVTSGLQLQATHKRIKLNAILPEQTVPLLQADQALLQQALHNLVENAIKYTEGGGKVDVRVMIRQGQMVFVVSDTGIGISPVDQPRLFEKFFRGGQIRGAAGRQSGTGLGLAIVRSIAERHGGKVWLESQLGRGSTFYLAIPLRQSISTPA